MRLVELSIALSIATGCSRHSPPPPPPDDMVAIPAQTFIGDDTSCPAGTVAQRPSDQRFRVSLTVGAYRIDRRVVTCEEYERCVDAGACTHKHDLMRCSADIAAAQRPAALDYCRWRNATIPSWNEWQLAIRGPDAYDYPTAHQHLPQYDQLDGPDGGTPTKSPLGVEYRWNGHAWLANEITRDDDCWDTSPDSPDRSLMVGPVSGFTAGEIHESLDTPGTDRGMFRCVRD